MTRHPARIALAGALLLAPVPAVVGAPAHAPAAPPAQALDLAALAKQSKTIELDEERLHAALVKGNPQSVVFSAALDLGGGTTAIAWSECTKTGCRGSVATLTGGADRPKLAKKAALVAPAKVFAYDGFAFEPPALADLDGDGAPEIILHYQASEPPRPAVGSMAHEYVAVYAPKDLSLIFSKELRRAGGDTEESCQWTLRRSGDHLLASGECNMRACLDSSPAPADCKPARKLSETWRKAAGQKTYTRVTNQPPSGSPRR